MASRDHERAKARLQVEYRSAAALLMAYSVNLSRGGMFLQCPDELPAVGSVLDLDITLPDRGVISLPGLVAWQRHEADESGPRGVGIEFDSTNEVLGVVVDYLVLNHEGIRILVQCSDPNDRKTLYRRLRSIVGKASVVFAEDDVQARGLLSHDTDLVVIDADDSEQAALATLHMSQGEYDIPVICLAQEDERFDKLEKHGAEKVLANPPTGSDLRKAVMDLLSSPRRVSQSPEEPDAG